MYIKNIVDEIMEVLVAYNNGTCPFCNEPQYYYREWDDGYFICCYDHRIHEVSYETQYEDVIEEIKEKYKRIRGK